MAGDAAAENDLGTAYALGKGVDLNIDEAERWFRLAARAGYAPAQANLGYLYEKGLGVSEDYDAALKLYRTAAEQRVRPGSNSHRPLL